MTESRLVFLDTETTGLNPEVHQVWEIAWAFETGDVRRLLVRHTTENADPESLRLNGYLVRNHRAAMGADWREGILRQTLEGATIVASNPAFDTSFLRRRWGYEPWYHRKLDLATYAMPYLGAERPVGLAAVAAALGVEQPDHTATEDVRTLRACFLQLRDIYRTTPRKDNA